jgi:hypothetical protein
MLRETTSRDLCGLVCPSRTGNRTQNSRVAGARPNHQPIGGSDPNHQVIWSPPRGCCCSTYYKAVREVFVTAAPSTKLFAYSNRSVCLLLQDLL